MTKDDIKIGSVLQNNDPRKAGQDVQVEAIFTAPSGSKFVTYRSAKRVAHIRFDRIFVDGRQRAQGYNLLAMQSGAEEGEWDPGACKPEEGA